MFGQKSLRIQQKVLHWSSELGRIYEIFLYFWSGKKYHSSGKSQGILCPRMCGPANYLCRVIVYCEFTLKSCLDCCTLLMSHISRILCIDNWGQPTSMVAMPSLADMIGPIVEPHGESLRTTKSWGEKHVKSGVWTTEEWRDAQSQC